MLPPPAGSIRKTAETGPLSRICEWIQIQARPEMQRRALSASAIEQYQRCPYAFKVKRDWMVPEEAHASLQYGQAMHLALKAYFDGVRAGRIPGTEAVVACFLDEFAKAKIDEEEQRRRYEQDGREQLTRVIASRSLPPAGEVLENEMKFEIAIAGTALKGRIDRIDRIAGNQVRVVDYKTGNPKSQEDADKSLQLSVYALAAKQRGFEPVALAFINLRDGSVVQSSRAPAALLAAERKVMDVAANIAAGAFSTSSGIHCKTCSYRSICPAHEVQSFSKESSEKSEGDACASPVRSEEQLLLLG